MSTSKELIQKLKDFKNKLNEELPALATSISLSGKAFAERVIKDKGFGYSYSTKEIPSFFLKGKELNKSGLSYLNNTDYANWKGLRESQGLQTGYVDLSYSNKMWAGMFPKDVEVNLFEYVAPLGNNTVEGQNKMNYNFERYGDFIGKALEGDGMEALGTVAFEGLADIMDSLDFIKK